MKPLAELTIGDYVADMHDGLTALRAKFPHAEIRELARWSHGSDHPSYSPRMNKGLYVIGVSNDGRLICGYTYDGRTSGLVEIIPPIFPID